MEQGYQYMVCTRCWTYNQASFIGDTLNGFSMQKISFPVVFVIVDDASTDGEQEVLRQWCNNNLFLTEKGAAKQQSLDYGNVIFARHKEQSNLFFMVLLLHNNLYSRGLSALKNKYIQEWQGASKYIAFCEGDDYWTDPLKLQKQVDYLESNPDVAMCYTRCTLYDESNQAFGEEYGWPVKDFDQLFENNVIQTLTTVFRRSVYEEYMDKVDPYSRGWLLGDYPLWLYFALYYKIHLIEENTSVYRCLKESVSHSLDYDKQVRFEQSVYAVRKYYANLCPNTEDLLAKADEKYHDMLFYEASRCHHLQGLVEHVIWKIQQESAKQKRQSEVICNLRNQLYEQRASYETERHHLTEEYKINNVRLQLKKRYYKRAFIFAIILDALFLLTIIFKWLT